MSSTLVTPLTFHKGKGWHFENPTKATSNPEWGYCYQKEKLLWAGNSWFPLYKESRTWSEERRYVTRGKAESLAQARCLRKHWDPAWPPLAGSSLILTQLSACLSPPTTLMYISWLNFWTSKKYLVKEKGKWNRGKHQGCGSGDCEVGKATRSAEWPVTTSWSKGVLFPCRESVLPPQGVQWIHRWACGFSLRIF